MTSRCVNSPPNSALGDALRLALAREGTSPQHKDDAMISASEVLDRLHLAIQDLFVNTGASVRDAHLLALEAGRLGMRANPLPQWQHAVERISKSILKEARNEGGSIAALGSYILGLACLATTRRAESALRDLLVEMLLDERLPTKWPFAVACTRTQWHLLCARGMLNGEIERRVNAIRTERRIEKQNRLREQEERLRLLEEARRSRIKNATRKLDQLSQTLLHRATEPEFVPKELEVQDLWLLLCWGNKPFASSIPAPTTVNVRLNLGDRDFVRLWSAREAEYAARDYFYRLGLRVDDISITQLSGQSTSWKTHDLLVSGVPVDIKNARQSFSSETSYSEYLIPAFKEEQQRGTSEAVAVSAVLSTYLTADQILKGGRPHCTILGEVYQSQINALTDWINSEFSEELDISAYRAGGRLPGWLFDYRTEYHLPRRHAALEELSQEAQTLVTAAAEWPSFRVPLYLAALTSNEGASEALMDASISSTEAREEFRLMLQALTRMSSSVGISRRSLYLFIVAYTLRQARRQSSLWSPSRFTRLLFMPEGDAARRRPLGLDDPLGYIFAVIQGNADYVGKGQSQA